MTNQMHQVLDSTVQATQQINTPWQLAVALVLFLALALAASLFQWRQVFMAQRDQITLLMGRIDTLQDIRVREQSKLHEEHGTELSDLVKENYAVIQNLDKTLNNLTHAIQLQNAKFHDPAING